ncbi:MAG: hypothetical protein EOO61_19770 [Hymenobacter sp.]|nr:MAG: hypothetical protein EOO61_19770 [Hymenobacter sp.]
MKTATKLGTIGAPIITINPELDKYDDTVLFPEKVEKAKQIIACAGLPPVKRQGQSSLISKKQSV